MSAFLDMIATGPPVHIVIGASIALVLVTGFTHWAAGKGW